MLLLVDSQSCCQNRIALKRARQVTERLPLVGSIRAGLQARGYSVQSSSSSSVDTSSSMGSSPTTSNWVPQSEHSTTSPLSVSSSTCTSASHSGQVPLGIFIVLQICRVSSVHCSRHSTKNI